MWINQARRDREDSLFTKRQLIWVNGGKRLREQPSVDGRRALVLANGIAGERYDALDERHAAPPAALIVVPRPIIN